MKKTIFVFSLSFFCIGQLMSQQKPKPEDTEVWSPVPKVITPGKNPGDPPSDAIVLFNGKDLSQWVSTNDTTKAAGWTLDNGLLRVNKTAGDIQTKSRFRDFQLHIEWRVPENITGSNQARGNSGIFLAAVDGGGYELQVLDSYNNATYVNGMAGSLYKQFIPLANPTRPPGEWQVYDVIWTAPRFTDTTLVNPAHVTVLFNGVLVENNVALFGMTEYIGMPYYKAHGPEPIRLQAHGDKSEPISFRNIWIRNL